MKTGRPAGIRSRPLAAWGEQLSDAQERAVRALLGEWVAGITADKATLDATTDRIADMYGTYAAATTARAARVGAAQEVADLRGIADDCEAVAASGVARLDLIERLQRRLRHFPPYSEARIAASDVAGHFARLERIRAALATSRPPDFADLRALADACRACPSPPTFTKRSRAPADEMQRTLAAMAAELSLLDPTATGRRAFVEELTAALGLDRASFRAR